jgi:hypothetical protein
MARRYKTYSQKKSVSTQNLTPEERKEMFIDSIPKSAELRLLKKTTSSSINRQRFYFEKLNVRHDSPFYRFQGVLTDTNFNISEHSDAWPHIDKLEEEQQGLEAARRRGLKGRGHLHRIEALEQKIKFVEQGML